jgi:hypothetical protein
MQWRQIGKRQIFRNVDLCECVRRILTTIEPSHDADMETAMSPDLEWNLSGVPTFSQNCHVFRSAVKTVTFLCLQWKLSSVPIFSENCHLLRSAVKTVTFFCLQWKLSRLPICSENCHVFRSAVKTVTSPNLQWKLSRLSIFSESCHVSPPSVIMYNVF